MNTQEIALKESGRPPFSLLTILKTQLLDPRVQQLLVLGSFLAYGLFFLNWQTSIDRYLITFAACLGTQTVFILLKKNKWDSLKSAAITALGLSLLFHAGAWYATVICGVLAIASKFLLRYKGKHIFNPGNFGIVMAILLTGQGWVSPGQWGNGILLLILSIVAGLAILFKVGRIDSGMTFLVVFGGLQYIYNILYLGWPEDFFFHQMTSGTVLLFAFFMITDPKTTPNAPVARIIWAAAVGIFAFILGRWFYVYSAPIWALFFLSPITALLDRKFIHPTFKWTN